MTVTQVLNMAASALVVVFAGVFLVTYTLRARWEEHAVGRYFVAAVATIGLLCAYTVVVTPIDLDGPVAAVLRVTRSLLLLAMAGLIRQATVAVRRAYPRRRKSP